MSGAAGDELVEWIDEDGRVIDVVTRRRMRAENLRHRSVGIVVLSTDGRLLVHRRSDAKDLRPGWWDVCAGGVVGVGEAWEAAARRELAEELGIADAPLEPLGVGRWDGSDSRELAHLFLTVHDGPYEYADGEVAEARLVSAGELWELMASAPFLPTCRGLVLPLLPRFAEPGSPDPSGEGAAVAWPTLRAVHHVEFTIEPFVEGHPGPHVTEPIDALRALGVDVEVGPFGSGCDVEPGRSAEIVATVVRLAFEHGADHVNIDVSDDQGGLPGGDVE